MAMDIGEGWQLWRKPGVSSQWGVFDDSGKAIGIKSDAPDDIRRSYEVNREFNEEYDRALAEGIIP